MSEYNLSGSDAAALRAADTTKSTQESPSSVWHEAYEKVGPAGLAAGALGSALAAGALAYGGVSAFRAATATKVLLFERTEFMGLAMKEALERGGNRVTWLRGVADETGTSGLDIANKTVKLNPAKFDYAVVAGGLDGQLQGPELVGKLNGFRVPSFGLSTNKGMSEAFKASGVAVEANKGVGFNALTDDSFRISTVFGNPARFQSHLDDLATRISADPSINKAAEKLLHDAMLRMAST